MIAICHLLAFVKSKPFLVKLGKINLLILAKTLNIIIGFLVPNAFGLAANIIYFGLTERVCSYKKLAISEIKTVCHLRT